MFSSDTVTVTTPTPTASITPSGPSGPLSLGAIVGVAIGGAVFILALLGFCIVMNGKRKRRAYLRRREEQKKNWPGPGAGEMFETPTSQRPLRGWDESPVSVTTDATYPRYFSPYSSQYNSPVSAIDGHKYHQWPMAAAQNIGVALSPDGDQSHHSWNDSKGKDKFQKDGDGYEMTEGISSGGGLNPYMPPPPLQAPVLSHPGYGRHGPSPHASFTEEDFNSGRVI
jgi:hypothetical protein